MKILLYCDWFKEYTSYLAMSLASDLNEVSLIIRENTDEYKNRTADELELKNKIIDKRVSVFNLKGKYSSFISLIQLYKYLKIKKKEGYSCFHMQQTSDPRFLILILFFPIILTLHEPVVRKGEVTLKNNLKRYLHKFIENIYRKLSKVIIVHTIGCAKSLTVHERKKSVVIPHGVSILNVDKQKVTDKILFFGRSAEYKGIDILLEAMKKVWEILPEAKLRILASPGNFVVEDIKEERVEATWNGFTNEELENELINSKIVCMPYLTASGSGVGAQAYGAGKIIVASDLDGLRELVETKEFLVPPNNVSKLADALILALKSDTSLKKIDYRNSWPQVALSHLEVYKKI